MAQHSYSSSDSDVGLHQRQFRKAELSEAFINYRKGEFDPKLDGKVVFYYFHPYLILDSLLTSNRA